MFPFFNSGAVNSNGNNQSSAPMQQQQQQQQSMMNPSNFPPNPTQFQQQTMNPPNPNQFQQQTMNPQMSAPLNFPALPSQQQAPMNFNQIPQNQAQLLNQNLLLALGLGVLNQMQQGVNPFLRMPMTMQNFNGQGTPPGNVNMPQNSTMGFGYNSPRPQLSMNSNVPNQLPMNSNIPNQLQMNPNIPNQMQNTSQQVVVGQAFAPRPIQNSLQNGFQQGVTGRPQNNNTNPPQGLNNQLGGSRQNNFARNANQQGSHNGFSNQLGKRNPNFQKFQTKGGNNDGRKPQLAKNMKAPQAAKRSLPLNYSEQEIKQWREARKKNFPTEANIEKRKEKKKDPEISKKEAALRRQELKEILAKQAELGCEVAEVPPSYLSVPGADDGRAFNENDRRVRFKQNDGNFHNNRRPWKQNDRGPYGHNPSYTNHRQNNRFSKKPWQMNGASGSHDEEKKREATLFRMLLETNIRRDKRHLLQVFRTMVMNSFFKDFPEKPLKFPQVVVREIGNEEGILGETEEALDDDEDGESQDSCANAVASVTAEKEGENQEEGEITD